MRCEFLTSSSRRTSQSVLAVTIAGLAILAALGLGTGHLTLPGATPSAAGSTAGPAIPAVPTSSRGCPDPASSGLTCDVTRSMVSSAPTLDYQWTNVSEESATTPSARAGADMVWDASDSYFLLYGGFNTLGNPMADTWTYANGSWTNITSTILGTPPALIGPMAYDPSTHTVVLVGTFAISSNSGSFTWSYHNRVWTNLTASSGTPPARRSGEALTTDTAANDVLLFGGYRNGNPPFQNDTWMFQNGQWTNITSTVGPIPGNFIYPSLGDDPAIGGAVLAIGAFFGGAFQTLTYLFANGHWQNVTATLTRSPPLSQWPSGGYLPAISAYVWISTWLTQRNGANAYTPVTWEFVDGGWVNDTVPTATGYYTFLPSGAADPIDSSFLLYGGDGANGPYYHSTWVLSSGPSVSVTSSRSSVDEGQTAWVNASLQGGSRRSP